MSEWPKTVKEAYEEEGLRGTYVVPKMLAKELYEALQELAERDNGLQEVAEAYPKGASARIIAALARYEQEVGK